jgi:hypothetical protein
VINFIRANESTLNSHSIAGFIHHEISISDTQNESSLEFSISDNTLLELFDERCRELGLPAYTGLAEHNENLEITIGLLEDKIRDLQENETTLRQQIAELKTGR